MTDFELDKLLESDLAAYNLVVQVTQQDECLLIMLNRPADSNLDYTALTKIITTRIKTLQLPEIYQLVLCSRVLGEYDVDWQTQLELISRPAEPIVEEDEPQIIGSEAETSSDDCNLQTPDNPSEASSDSVDATASSASKFSNYCFTRNKALLTFQILPPEEKVAKLIQFFHALPDSVKEDILPIVEEFFRSSSVLTTEQFDLEVQQWFEQLTQLNNSESRKASIWLSRYCYNPEKTIAEVMAILELETAKAAATSEQNANTEEQPPKPVSRTEATYKQTYQTPTQTNTRQSNKAVKSTNNLHPLTLPVGWLIFSIIVIIFAINSVDSTRLTAEACKNTTGKPEYCRLAVQLVGDVTFPEVVKDAVPLTPEIKLKSLEGCKIQANIYAGKKLVESVQRRIPVLSSAEEEILPGVLFADLTQTNFKQAGGTVRTGCVVMNTQKRPRMIGADVIPNNWPNEPYKGKPISANSLSKTLGIFNILIALGAGTLFTVIGIFLAAMWGLGIRADSLETIFKAAFLLGIIQAMTSTMSSLSLVFTIALDSIALGVIGGFVKGFHVQWAEGYRVVAAGAITIIVVRYLLGFALLSLIASLVH